MSCADLDKALRGRPVKRAGEEDGAEQAASYTYPVPQKPLSAEYFDGWYADQAATQVVAEIMNRHMGFPPDTRAGTVPGEAIPELAEALRLRPGSMLLDLACGRGAYGR